MLGCDIDSVFYQVGELRREVAGNGGCLRDIIVTKSVGAGCELEYQAAGRDRIVVVELWKVNLCLEIGHAQRSGVKRSCSMAEDRAEAGAGTS